MWPKSTLAFWKDAIVAYSYLNSFPPCVLQKAMTRFAFQFHVKLTYLAIPLRGLGFLLYNQDKLLDRKSYRLPSPEMK